MDIKRVLLMLGKAKENHKGLHFVIIQENRYR